MFEESYKNSDSKVSFVQYDCTTASWPFLLGIENINIVFTYASLFIT